VAKVWREAGHIDALYIVSRTKLSQRQYVAALRQFVI